MTDPRIEAAARALRERNMAGKITRDWDEVPRSQKKKWLDMAGCALAAADAAAWRPMDSAPMDGSRMLIVKTSGFVCTARFYDGDWEGDDGYCVHDIKFMAGWQPLPSPPTTPEPTP